MRYPHRFGQARAELTAVYTSEDGTVYDSTDGSRIESYGNDKILAREVGGILDAEIAKGKNRTDILVASRNAIARLVRRGANMRPPAVRRRTEEDWGGRQPGLSGTHQFRR